jgi:mRNA (guanine-N7-)-methyltransferase
MAEEATKNGRRPSMYDPARDIFAKEAHDGSTERGTTTRNTSASYEGEIAPIVTTSTAASQPVPGSHYDRFPVSKPWCQT